MAYLIKIVLFLEVLQLSAIGAFRACLHPRYRGLITTGDLLIAVAIPLVGVFGQNKNVFYAMLFLMPLLWIGNPTGLAKRYVLTLVLFPELLGVYAVGGLYLGPLSSFTFFNAGALLALAMTRRGTLRPVRLIDAAVWTLFFVDLLLVARGSPLNGTLRFIMLTLLLVISPYFIIARAVGSARAAGDTVSFLVLGGFCNAVVALFESVKHWSMYQIFNETLHVKTAGLAWSTSMRAGLLRASGPIGNYEVLGLLTGTSLIAAISIRRRFAGPGFYLIVALLAGGLFVSQARSAWIATVAGLAFQAIYERQWRRMAIIACGIGLVSGLAFASSSSEGTIAQILGTSGHAESTTQYRQTLLSRGLEEARRHPLTGQALDQLQVSMNDLRQGEHIIDFVNTHLFVVLVGGFGALVLWIGAWALPMGQGWRVRRRIVDPDTVPASLPFALIGMTFVFLTFTSSVDRILSLAAISMGLMSVCVRLAEERGTRPQPHGSTKPERRIGRLPMPAG